MLDERPCLLERRSCARPVLRAELRDTSPEGRARLLPDRGIGRAGVVARGLVGPRMRRLHGPDHREREEQSQQCGAGAHGCSGNSLSGRSANPRPRVCFASAPHATHCARALNNEAAM